MHLFILLNILPLVVVFPILVEILRTILKRNTVVCLMSHIFGCLLHLSENIPYEVTGEKLPSLNTIHPLTGSPLEVSTFNLDPKLNLEWFILNLDLK